MTQVRIIEVGPRDGLQNEKVLLSLQQKISFIEGLFGAGVKELELTSFVRSDKIPQLSDAVELCQEIKKLGLLDRCWTLVPNVKGMEQALKLGVSKVALFTSPSEKFNQKNINCSVKDSLIRINDCFSLVAGMKIMTRGYLSMVFGCPYEGEIEEKKVLVLCEALMKLGISELSLGDTIGVATPKKVRSLLLKLQNLVPTSQLAMHFHDTKGMALINIYESYNLGLKSFDSSAAGLGGCPYAKGATGNVATEDVVNLFESQGISTGINLQKLVEATVPVMKQLGSDSLSKVHRYILKQQINNEKK